MFFASKFRLGNVIAEILGNNNVMVLDANNRLFKVDAIYSASAGPLVVINLDSALGRPLSS